MINKEFPPKKGNNSWWWRLHPWQGEQHPNEYWTIFGQLLVPTRSSSWNTNEFEGVGRLRHLWFFPSFLVSNHCPPFSPKTHAQTHSGWLTSICRRSFLGGQVGEIWFLILSVQGGPQTWMMWTGVPLKVFHFKAKTMTRSSKLDIEGLHEEFLMIKSWILKWNHQTIVERDDILLFPYALILSASGFWSGFWVPIKTFSQGA